ncbi:uncharacterized protein LOC144674969 [Cetorhinus maximus]
MSSQGRVSPRVHTSSMDAVDGLSPVKISCQSEASPDSTETEGMCYYEVDHSSSQSYYSTYSQYRGSDSRMGSPATTAPPGSETHTPHEKTGNRAQLTPDPLTVSDLPSVPHGPSLMQRPQSPLLHHARSIQESASLLEWANSSLERMERRFISSIQTLEQFTGRQWESAEQEQDQKSEQELEQSRRIKNQQLDKAAGLPISGAEFCCVTSELLQDMTNRSVPLPRTEEQQTLDTIEFPSCSGAYAPQARIVQDAGGAFTACDLLDRWDPCSSKQTTSSPERKLLTFNLMQEIIDELRVKRNPTAGDNINVGGDKDSRPTLSHTHQTNADVHPAAKNPHLGPEMDGSSALADLPAGSEGKGQLVTTDLGETELCNIPNVRRSREARSTPHPLETAHSARFYPTHVDNSDGSPRERANGTPGAEQEAGP